jgi:hypothetical protein
MMRIGHGSVSQFCLDICLKRLRTTKQPFSHSQQPVPYVTFNFLDAATVGRGIPYLHRTCIYYMKVFFG